MKLVLLTFYWTLFLQTAFCQQNKNADFEKTAKSIISAFQKKDNQTINKYIHAKTGVYLLYRTGVYDQYKKFNRIIMDDTSEYPRFHSIEKNLVLSSINTKKFPEYDCDKGKWSSYGTFSALRTTHDLSTVCRNLNKYMYEEMEEKITEKEIKKYIGYENKSRKIICCKKGKSMDSEIIFHLIYIQNKWYLWLVDTITTDCSA